MREWAGPVADVLDLDVQERRMARVTQHVGVPLAPMKPAFVAAAAAEPLYFGWPGRLAERGHRITAEILAERLRSETRLAK